MLSVQGNRSATYRFGPYLEKFLRDLIALIVGQKNAVSDSLVWIAAGDDIDQQSSFREPVECSCHTCCKSGRSNPGTDRHQELQLGCNWEKGRGHDPGIFARSSRREQHTDEAKFVGRLGNLLQIGMVHGSCLFGRAKVPTVAMSGQKPEYFHK